MSSQTDDILTDSVFTDIISSDNLKLTISNFANGAKKILPLLFHFCRNVGWVVRNGGPKLHSGKKSKRNLDLDSRILLLHNSSRTTSTRVTDVHVSIHTVNNVTS